MFQGLFHNISETEKNSAIEGIIQHATPRKDFFLMLILSVSMATFGILLNSTVILIGSMLIAPLLYPILSLALGIIVADNKLIGRSVYTVIKSVFFSLTAGLVIGFLFSAHDGSVVTLAVAGMPFSPMYVVVAAISGFAAAFAVTKPHLNETLPGVAISVALVPPLAAAGIALSLFDWALFSASFLLFVVNIIGIVFSSMVVFALLRFSVKKTVTKEAVKEEEKVIKKEEAVPPTA
ncbi:MAG: TIGR00341 family protein [Candidatus Taylorbacteria bacterium CG10_big_fil_rev_8_21_14_0_10_41_48]|uniref:TIGR00341 family protein n=1 Tax=Candidatus Taylorbacteria bacterium CG10_big_fil_rev_8_21_14_0_10_41_48 TaxID=1975024 RepID=A0A2M8LBP0_9BACT|nr:MAG: TIGR00341 family protein [Candidatus Taylorbacteria bacterium CG10_big_fil_rev_8_21_14_0_10_41_48]